jgi:hypothetical protein
LVDKDTNLISTVQLNHKENIEEENNGYVVFKLSIYGSAEKKGGGEGGGGVTPPA